MFEIFSKPEWLIQKQLYRTNAYALYEQIVTQSRQSYFYTNLNVPDTFKGRFELMALHLFLILSRLKEESSEVPQAKAISQILSDQFVVDMDSSLRLFIKSESNVPKNLKTLTEMLYGRIAAYEQALKSQDIINLKKTLCRNIYKSETLPKSSQMLDILSLYVMKQNECLLRCNLKEVIALKAAIDVQQIKSINGLKLNVGSERNGESDKVKQEPLKKPGNKNSKNKRSKINGANA